MCGIGAIIGEKTKNLEKLMEPIRNRGEDKYFNEHIKGEGFALSCNRLSIVGRDNGKQPASNETGSIHAVLNGEIYNYLELRQMLESRGHVFSTDSDTEILVHGYESFGEDIPSMIDGQFAFLVYDENLKEFLAARDPSGIKPLFVAEGKESEAIFGSEIKQLDSLQKTINEILPSHILVKKGTKEYNPFPFSLKAEPVHSYSWGGNNAQEIIENLRISFDEAVKKRVQTDLPIAVFLSGGIDSTAVLATARKYHDDVSAIIMGFDGINSDSVVAKRYCEENDIPYIHEQPPSEKELFDLVPEMVRITESYQPNMIRQAGLSYHLAKIASELDYKVVLCGEGADELFAGYPEFQESDESINIQCQNFASDLYRTQLQRVDRTAMAHTVEVRVPFLDIYFKKCALNVPGEFKIREGQTKWILRRAMEDRLPDYIVNRDKIVLSEGMGHKGNDPGKGMFSEFTDDPISYFFNAYMHLGYGFLKSQKAPYVNATNTVK